MLALAVVQTARARRPTIISLAGPAVYMGVVVAVATLISLGSIAALFIGAAAGAGEAALR